MAASTLIRLADAVVASLAGGVFSLPFEVTRGYRPLVEPAGLTAARVTVVPKRQTFSAASRESGFIDAALDIGVQRKVNANDAEALDALMQLADEIGEHISRQRLDGLPEAAWLALEHEPVFAPEHLEQLHVFTSVLTVTYRVRRTR